MDRIKITNESQAELVIEDIGVRLAVGATVLINSQLLGASRDFRTHPMKKFIKVSKVGFEKAPIWPFIPKPIPVKPKPADTQAGTDKSNINNEFLDKLNDTMTQILNHLRKIPQSQYIFTRQPSEPVSQTVERQAKDCEPMFIPNRILPQDIADARINIKTDEITKSNFESSKEYLKALKKEREKK